MNAALAWTAVGIAATLAFVLGLVLSRHSGERRRFVRVTEAVDELASGNLAHRVHLPGEDDASRLGDSLNGLASALQEARTEGLRREEAHKQLISNLSHDLRTPITSIAGYVDALQRGIGEDPSRHLAMLAAKTDELTRLTDDLFYLTKLDSGDLDLDLRPSAVDEIVRQAVLGFERELAARGIEVALDIPDEPCMALVDEAAVRRIVSNFVANALKHAAGMTRFGVDVACLGRASGDAATDAQAEAPGEEACRVTVWDDGAGFGQGIEELLERGASVGPGGGSGLGLSISHDLAARMGGRISASSVPGERTAVSVEFPLAGASV